MTNSTAASYQSIGYLDSSIYGNSHAVSDLAGELNRELAIAIDHQSLVANGEKYRKLIDTIYEMWESAGSIGWDGYDANPVNVSSVMSAIRFVRVLTLTELELPEINADVSGSITFDWENSDGDSVTVVVKNEKLLYAALYANKDEDHGVATFNGIFLPPPVLIHINQVAKEE